MSLSPASGIGKFYARSAKIIRFARHGCTNRPIFHVVVTERRKGQHQPVIEQLGTFDPLPNENNERLVSFNYERIRYWLGSGAHLSTPVADLLGMSGFLPIHPKTYMTSWRNRSQISSQETQQ